MKITASRLVGLALAGALGLVRADAGAQDPQPDAPKPEASAPPARDATPEAALRTFFGALVNQDEPTLRGITLPVDGFEWLLKGEKLTGMQAIAARVGVGTMPIRPLKPGDELILPGGRKVVVQPEEVSDTRRVLIVNDAPIPTRLTKVGAGWKVDAAPIIAARKAAAAARAKAEGSKPPAR